MPLAQRIIGAIGGLRSARRAHRAAPAPAPVPPPERPHAPSPARAGGAPVATRTNGSAHPTGHNGTSTGHNGTPVAARPGLGLADAARAAAASGMTTSTTFRRAIVADEADDDAAPEIPDNGTADRIIGSIAMDSVVRTAPDGEKYWGPVDNESARAKACGRTLDIDRDECIGCGTCVEHIDTVFFLEGEEGKAYVISQEGAMDRVQDAIDACPVTCISWKE
jgi:ferredoxin